MSDHKPECDINDVNVEGIHKPCNCGAINEQCGQRYRVLIDGWKWSGTRHCTKPKGHKGKCGKAN